jgi:urease accessory protein
VPTAVAAPDASSAIRRDRRSPAAIGRDARLELVFAVRDGRTMLVHGYAEPPFRVSRPFECDGELHMMLTSSGPGVFGGDCLRQDIRLAAGARVRLTSQAAVQVHPGNSEAIASLVSHFDVEHDARLACQWLPAIPFAAAHFEQRIAVNLAENAALYWSDGFMAGRAGMGERWRFAHLAHELRLVRAGVLEYLERYAIEPASSRLESHWIAADAVYFGSVVVSGVPCSRDRVEALHTALGLNANLRAAVDGLGPALCVARLASASGPAFHAARATLDASFQSNL